MFAVLREAIDMSPFFVSGQIRAVAIPFTQSIGNFGQGEAGPNIDRNMDQAGSSKE